MSSDARARSASPVEIIRFFVRRHLQALAGLTAFGLAVGVLEALNLAVFVPILGGLVGEAPGQGQLYKDKPIMGAVHFFLRSIPVPDPFIAACIAFLALTLGKGVLAVAHEYATARATSRILHEYRTELMKNYQHYPLSFFQTNRVGALVYNLTQPPIMVTRLMYMIPRSVVDALRFIFVLLLLLMLEPVITIIIAGASAALYFTFSRSLAVYLYQLALRRRAVEQQMNSIATEWLHGIHPIRIAGMDRHWIDGFRDQNLAACSSYVRTSVILASPRHLYEMAGFSLLLIALMITYQVDPGAFKSHVATIGLFAMGLARVLPSIAALARTPLEIRNTLPDAAYLYTALNETNARVSPGKQPFGGLRTGIRVENVSVDLSDRARILDGLSLQIPRRSVCAIVGPSGSGKTTLLSVLLGIQIPAAGRIFYDDTDLRTIAPQSLQRKIGYVGQDVVLFHGTVRENIAFFREEVSIEHIRRVAELAEIAAFIESLPEGYDTRVGERGVNLSGGEAQRIAIARALINDPDVLVLDEPTSALDSTSEQAVLHALRHASRDRTVVIVTHRLAAAKWADHIYVLQGGRLVQVGNWGQLIVQREGLFHMLASEQRLTDTERFWNR